MKGKVDKLNVDELAPIPPDLSKLGDVVKNKVLKRTEYDELVRKVNSIDTSKFIKKTDYNAKIEYIEDKIPTITNVATYSAIDAKIIRFKVKIPSVANLATIDALTVIDKEILDIDVLVNKADYDAKVS